MSQISRVFYSDGSSSTHEPVADVSVADSGALFLRADGQVLAVAPHAWSSILTVAADSPDAVILREAADK